MIYSGTEREPGAKNDQRYAEMKERTVFGICIIDKGIKTKEVVEQILFIKFELFNYMVYAELSGTKERQFGNRYE